jgi:hypothetical protein
MKPTTAPLSHLAHDLKGRSSGSFGHHLIERLENYCLDLLGTETPLQFAQALQDPAPGSRRVLEELLEWTALDNDFLLIALVALSPDLESIVLRLSWGRPSKDTVSEVLAQATVALHWSSELVEGERVNFVLEHALAKTRNEQRQMSRHTVTTTFIPDDYDVDEPEIGPTEVAPSLLVRAEANRVICKEDAELIRKTRGQKISLQFLADESGTSYDALRMRRTRAEDCLRRRFRTTDLR